MNFYKGCKDSKKRQLKNFFKNKVSGCLQHIKTFLFKQFPTFLFIFVKMNDKALKILEQVRKLYHRYGIKSVTMDDVARHLCISKKTLYEHFEDKEDLVGQVIMLQVEAEDQCFSQIAEKKLNAIEELFEVYKLINLFYHDFNPSIEYDIRKYYPDLYMKIREIRRKRMYDSTLRNIEKGKKEGYFRSGIDASIISKMHVFRTENLFDNDLFTNEEINNVNVFNEMFVYHINGLLSEKGREFFERNFEKIKAGLS